MREDNPDNLWRMIEELQSKVTKLEKYKTFHDMLRLANTPMPSEVEGDEL